MLVEAAKAQEASLAHLLGHLRLIEARVRSTVAQRRAGDPDPEDRFRGLYISHAHVDRLLNGTGDARAPDPAETAALEAIEAAADAAERDGADIRLRRLARSFRLGPLDVELVLIAVAPDLDARFERLYGYLQDDVSRRRASIGLGLELCGVPSTSAFGRSRLAATGPLVDGCLVLVEEGDRPFLTRSLRVPDRVTVHLLGGDASDPAVAALAHPNGSLGTEGGGGPLSRWLADGHSRLAYVRERPGTSGFALASAAFAAGGRRTLALDFERLRPDDDPRVLASLADREARLIGAGIVVGPIEALMPRGLPAIRAFSEMTGPVVFVGSRGWDPAWATDVPFLCDAPAPNAAQRAELWGRNLNGDMPEGVDLSSTIAQYRLTAEQVKRAAVAARLQADASGRAIGSEDLKSGARAQNAAGLERLARRVEPAVSFGDLVLPPETLEQLREILTRSRQRERVLDLWKMAGPASRRRGLTALFAGPSGTGKTMAAEVLSGELGLDLYTVDLATVVDKYVGETEKNLDRIFAEAERVNGVLLFDEADALFGKRSEVRDAHDRYANVEVAYLLQRMELFEGIAVLATNLRSNLDEAFARRLDAIVDFPEPDEEYRLRLWDKCLGANVPRKNDLDLPFMAKSFKLSGGGIRNIAVTAAYLAADADRPVGMSDLVLATQREYRKLGRMVVESEFGPYFDLSSRPES